MNETFKRYLLSSLTTFITAFCGVIALQLQAGVSAGYTTAAVIALLGVAGRAGVKAVVEAFAAKNADLPQG